MTLLLRALLMPTLLVIAACTPTPEPEPATYLTGQITECERVAGTSELSAEVRLTLSSDAPYPLRVATATVAFDGVESNMTEVAVIDLEPGRSLSGSDMTNNFGPVEGDLTGCRIVEFRGIWND